MPESFKDLGRTLFYQNDGCSIPSQTYCGDIFAKYQADPSHIKQIIHDGSQRARNVAKETMAEVREAMGIIY
jgi:hypothetical protein